MNWGYRCQSRSNIKEECVNKVEKQFKKRCAGGKARVGGGGEGKNLGKKEYMYMYVETHTHKSVKFIPPLLSATL